MPPSLQTSKYFSFVTFMGNMNIENLKFVFYGIGLDISAHTMFIESNSIQVFMP